METVTAYSFGPLLSAASVCAGSTTCSAVFASLDSGTAVSDSPLPWSAVSISDPVPVDAGFPDPSSSSEILRRISCGRGYTASESAGTAVSSAASAAFSPSISKRTVQSKLSVPVNRLSFMIRTQSLPVSKRMAW